MTEQPEEAVFSNEDAEPHEDPDFPDLGIVPIEEEPEAS